MYRRILFSLTVLLFALSLFGCAQSGIFNGEGTAEVKLNFDREYDGLFISCPDGGVSGQGASYTVSLSSRKAADIIVSCKGYESVILSFSTKQLSAGRLEKEITLAQKYYEVIAQIHEASFDITGISAATVSQGAPVDVIFMEGAVKAMIASPQEEIIFSCDGYHSVSVSTAENDFINYQYNTMVSFVPKDELHRIDIVLRGDKFSNYGVNLRPMINSGENTYHTLSDFLVLTLDARKSYYINSRYFYANDLQKLAADGIHNIALSYAEINDTRVTVTFSDYTLEELFVSDAETGQQLYHDTYFSSKRADISCHIGTKLRFYGKMQDDYTLYEVEYTGQKNIALEYKKEELQSRIDFFDMSDGIQKPFSSANLKLFDRQNEPLTAEQLEDIVIENNPAQGYMILNTKIMFDYGFAKAEYSENSGQYSITRDSYTYALVSGKNDILFDKTKQVRVNLKDSAGNIIDASKVFDGWDKEYYLIDAIENEYIQLLPHGYESVHFQYSYRHTYVDKLEVEMDICLTYLTKVEVRISGESIWIDHINMNGNTIEKIEENGICYIVLRDSTVGREITFHYYSGLQSKTKTVRIESSHIENKVIELK